MKYFVIEPQGIQETDNLWEVSKPKKSSNGNYTVSKVKLVTNKLINKSSSSSAINSSATQISTSSYDYITSYRYSAEYIQKYYKSSKMLDSIKKLANDVDVKDLDCLQNANNSILYLRHHYKGNWTAKLEFVYRVNLVSYPNKVIETSNKRFTTNVTISNSSTSIPKNAAISKRDSGKLTTVPFTELSQYLPGSTIETNIRPNNGVSLDGYGEFAKIFSAKNTNNMTTFVQFVLETCTITIDLTFSSNSMLLNPLKDAIGEINQWELGSIAIGSNSPLDSSNYCFYSKDEFDKKYKKYGLSLPITQTKLAHSCKDHDKSKEIFTTTSSGNNQANSSLTYNRQSVPFGDASKANYGTVGRFELGTTGTYKDGVAPVPYVMVELRGSEKDEKGYSLSIPANNNSFISLTHERNLHDSYNTFSLQLFDRDAMEVEAKLLLGWRYIVFWYTDFISTSKRFKGEVLDYTTVITGKGLMLTLTGYTSDTAVYTGKDSIPWSIFFEAGDYSFFYWLNNAGEYHGEVRIVEWNESEGKYIPIRDEFPTEYNKGRYKYNSMDGLVLGASRMKQINKSMYDWMVNSKNITDIQSESESYNRCNYFVQLNNKEDDIGSFTIYDNSAKQKKVPDEKIKQYRPYPVEWSLEQYNPNIGNNLAMFDEGLFLEKRPSNVVKVICAVNGWKTRDDYIKETKRVDDIPDQISMSYTEYILKKLIPISISNDDKGITQYYFWFDDEGYVHYEPLKETAAKSLYFNSTEKKDSYPLIAFTASTNGNILMQVNKAQTISAINYLTGDELDTSAYSFESDEDDELTSLYKTEEWYATNNKTLERQKNNLISKKDVVSYSNISSVPSLSDLKKVLKNRYGEIARYTYKASLDVYGCADLVAGQMVNIYIYLDDGARSNEPISKELKETYQVEEAVDMNDIISNSKPISEIETHTVTKTRSAGYTGNITLHHSSGTYFINKITDTVSGGRYISSLQVLKIDSGTLDKMFGNVVEEDEGPKSWVVSPDGGDGAFGGGGFIGGGSR